MIKNKLDFKLINIALITLIIYLLYKTGHLWMGIIDKALGILGPFIAAFVIAYAVYPLLQFLERKKIHKSLGILIIVAAMIGLLSVVIILVAPVMFNQLSSLFSSIISFLKEMSVNYDWNVGNLQETLSKSFNEIIVGFGKYVSNGAINIIGVSINLITTIFITFSATIYFLADMDKIRNNISKILKNANKKLYKYVHVLDIEMKNYFLGFVKIVFITLVEYTLVFYIIGHPNAILLGFVAAIANIIPYFGGIFTNILAMITAFVVSPVLFIKTVIAFLLLSNVDGYIINPFVYGKSNKVHPILVILAVFGGGVLFGFMGIMISLPLAIIGMATFKFYKKDVLEKVNDIKSANKDDEKEKKK